MNSAETNKQNSAFHLFYSSTALDVRALLFRFLRNWYWFLIALLFAFILAWLYVKKTSNIYQIESAVLIKEDNAAGPSSGGESLVIDFAGLDSKSAIYDELEKLQSRALMREVIDSLDLDTRISIRGKYKSKELYNNPFLRFRVLDIQEVSRPEKFKLLVRDSASCDLIRKGSDTTIIFFNIPFEYQGHDYVVQRLDTNDLLQAGAEFQISVSPIPPIIVEYLRKINFSLVEKSNVVKISLQDELPSRAIAVIDKLIELYNKNTVMEKNRVGNSTLNFIEGRLNVITNELFQVEKKLENYKRRNEVPTSIQESAGLLLDKVNTTQSEIATLDMQISLLEQYASFVDSIGYEYIPVSNSIMGESITSLFSQYNDLITKREQLLADATTSNPTITGLERQIVEFKDLMTQSMPLQIRELVRQKEQLNKQLAPVEKRMISIPTNERELIEIGREKQVKENLFIFLLQTREETAISLSAQLPNASVIDPPVITRLVWPKKIQIYILVFLLGIGIPAGILFLKERLNNNIYTENDIKAFTEVPYLGQIVESKRNKNIVVESGSRSAAAERFRLLRTNLQFLQKADETPVILITSSSSGDGKSFIASNLGMSIALSGKKVILIGADLRKPKLSTYISGEAPTKGLSNYLVGQEQSIDKLIVPSYLHDKLSFIGSGPLPPNPSELLMTENLSMLIEALKQKFDYIIIDTAPIGLVTDALLFKDVITSVLFIVRFDKTTKQELQIIDDIYREKKLPNPAIILNGVKTGRGYGYGYGNGYGYYEE